MKKGLIKKALAVSLCAGSVVSMSSCGNSNILDMNNNLNYIVIEENDVNVLHKVKNWTDASSDSVCVKTECCGNYIWTTVNKSILYENKPDEYSYDQVCTGLN